MKRTQVCYSWVVGEMFSWLVGLRNAGFVGFGGGRKTIGAGWPISGLRNAGFVGFGGFV